MKDNNNTTTTSSTTPMRGEEYSPMHCVKPVPRDSHVTTHGRGSTNAKGAANVKDASSDNIESVAANLSSELSNTTDSFPHAPSGKEPVDAGNSWMGRKVDALFSPVLSFLNVREQTDKEKNVGGGGDDSTKQSDDAVSVAIRSALLEASKELEEDIGHNHHHHHDGRVVNNHHDNGNAKESYEEADFDHVPVMTHTDSTSKDAEGDAVMNSQDLERIGLKLSEDSLEPDNNTATDNHNDHDYDDEDDHSEYQGHTDAALNQHNNHHQDYDDEEEEEFNPFLFIKSLPPYNYAIPPGWNTRSKALPPPHPTDTPPLCLVLDLDETLVHCTVEPIPNADMVFPVEFNGMEYTVHVRCRPYLMEFLERVCGEFEVVVFTASQQVYADKLLDMIDPGE